MTDIKLEEIEALLEMFNDSDWQELSLRVEGCSLFVSRYPASPGLRDVSTAVAGAVAAPAAGADVPLTGTPPTVTDNGGVEPSEDNLRVVEAPSLGTFYQAPKPGAPPYVEIGQEVDEHTELCLIEVMKLFTTVTAGMKGIVREVCVEEGAMVEHGQPLFKIQPVS